MIFDNGGVLIEVEEVTTLVPSDGAAGCRGDGDDDGGFKEVPLLLNPLPSGGLSLK